MVFRNLETGTTPGSYGCQASLTIDAQDGGAFAGTLRTDGSGWNTDRFCTGGGTLRGEIVAPGSGAVQAQLEGAFSTYQCTPLTGGTAFTGIATDAEIRLQSTDLLRCPVNMDGGPGIPFAEFERTVTLAFERF